MIKKIILVLAILSIVGVAAFAEDLTIDFKVDISGKTRVSYFTFTGPIRYMALEQDHFDGVTGASLLGSTHIFQPYRNDVLGKKVMPDGLRGLFLYGVAGADLAKSDKLKASKASNGVITVEYSHRGSDYKIVTDRQGMLSLTSGTFLVAKDGVSKNDEPDPTSMFYWMGSLKAELNGDILTVMGGLDAVKR
ncbi:MAG: hypothetical protein JEZ04_19605 [Spirochaetales bacterium]|nr:hypothetical protein [Spirochaetales bacterium]